MVFISILKLCGLIGAILSIIPQIHSLSLKMRRIDEIDTDLFPKNLTLAEKHKKLAELSRARAIYLRNPAITNSIIPSLNHSYIPRLRLQLLVNAAYVVSASIGTNEYPANLLMDTGSSSAWVQCEGCENCFQIDHGPYRYTQSNSFKTLAWNHPLCTSGQREGDFCVFEEQYVKGYVRGVVGADTFRFPSSDGGVEPFTRVAFGCVLQMVDVGFGDNTNIAGLMGLGPDKDGLLMQALDPLRGRFSYCLPKYGLLGRQTTMYFGQDIPPVPPDAKSVRILNEMYDLPLVGISVNSERLNIGPSYFAPRTAQNGFKGGFIIDTGSTFMIIVETAFNLVKSKFIDHFASYNIYPVEHGQDKHGYQLCYLLPNPVPNGFRFPTMTFHFDNGVDLDGRDYTFTDLGNNVVCAAMAEIDDDGPTILGAAQLDNIRFVFDNYERQLKWYPESCS